MLLQWAENLNCLAPVTDGYGDPVFVVGIQRQTGAAAVKEQLSITRFTSSVCMCATRLCLPTCLWGERLSLGEETLLSSSGGQ